MNLGTVFLITILIAFPFSLKGVTPSNKEIHGLLGYSVFLPTPEYTGILDRVQWVILTAGKGDFIGRKTGKTVHMVLDKYNISSNGSLRIDNLVKEDAGDYKVDGHNKNGAALFNETIVTLKVHEPLPQPQLIENCSSKTLICQVESSASQNIEVKLFQNNKQKRYQEQKYVNGTWKWTFLLTNFTGKFRCEVTSGPAKNQTEKEIKCLGTASCPMDLIYFMVIGGSVVILIIFLALIVYCVQKKRAERREIEDQERELQARVAADESRHRKLPHLPNQAHQQQQRLPILRSELQQPSGPPQPCPRPPQRKPPRHMKERP